jgi:hypothetical protein
MRSSNLLLLLCGVFAAVNLVASPVPATILGLNANVVVGATVYPVSYGALGNGGGFALSITPNGSLISYDTIGWCVDVNNDIGGGQNYQADLIAIDGTWVNGTNPFVRKGENTVWYDGLTTLTPEQRYQMAAYIVSQFANFPDGPTPDGPSQKSLNSAQWATTADSDPGNNILTPAASLQSEPIYAGAKAYILANPTYGYNEFALISGVVDSNGVITTPGTTSGGILTTQTFLIQISGGVPEPGSIFLMGTGLSGLALLIRRKKKS